MKKLISLFLAIFIVSCSSDTVENSNETVIPFSIDAVTSNNTVTVDQDVVVNLTSPEVLKGIGYSYDNFTTSMFSYPGSGFGNFASLKFRFVDVGQTTVSFKGIKADDSASETKSITFNVVKGNRVKIVGLKVNSFDKINTSWDPEYADTDPNRLADVGFGITKLRYSNPFESTKRQYLWYKSAIKENQGDLTWDLTAFNLYIDPSATFIFGLSDLDNGGVVQDLTRSIDGVQFSLTSYIQTKPNTITLSYPDSKLEFVLQLEWPIE
ncbi:MAG: hypothetical protein V4497_02345 [Bacteroidota bacterium]